MNRPALLSRPAVRRLALAGPLAAGLALAAAVIPAGMASARGGNLPTTTTVSSSANPSGFGQLVTYTATVNNCVNGICNAVNGVGTVGFTDNGTPITGCTAVPVSGWPRPIFGVAACQATPAPGTHTVVATFTAPGTWYNPSTATLTQVANPPVCNPLYCSGGDA